MSLDIQSQLGFEKTGNNSPTPEAQLSAEVSKTDNSIIADAMNTMAQQELDATFHKFAPEELNNPEYIGQFTIAQMHLSAVTQDILASKWTPEEKTEQLETAFQEFLAEIWGIMGTQEAKNAQRAETQGKNMHEESKTNKEGSQEFQNALLKNIRESIAKKIQANQLQARREWDREGSFSQAEAMSLINNTTAFWPPGNPKNSA